MKFGSFNGIHSIIEVQCAGENLDSDIDILTLALFTAEDNELLAFVNMKTEECLAKGQFCSCHIDKKNSRQTKVKTLVLDLEVGESRLYGCNVTGLKSGTRWQVMSWTISARRERECSLIVIEWKSKQN